MFPNSLLGFLKVEEDISQPKPYDGGDYYHCSKLPDTLSPLQSLRLCHDVRADPPYYKTM